MINVSHQETYDLALEVLWQHKREVGGNYKGRFVQLFFGLKFFQNEIPSMYSGRFVASGTLQTMLDDLYSKSTRPLNNCVMMMFEKSHLARTGVVPIGGSYPSNIWRNNLNIQKGIGCYAPASDLSSPTFLNQSRVSCRHLVPQEAGTLSHATCSLCSTGGSYRSEDHRKWMQIHPQGSAYSVVDLSNSENFAPYVAPSGSRIPVYPFIVAVYHDASEAIVLGSRSDVGLDQFKNDFNLSQAEFNTYFDSSPDNTYNRQVLDALDLEFESPINEAAGDDSEPEVGEAPVEYTPVLNGTISAPPNFHSGWEAEQFVLNLLQQHDWNVHDVSRQRVGYDLLAKKGHRTVYVEVKSSLGLCSPNLTSREWEQATRLGENYILSIVENFDFTGEQTNTVYFLRNPSAINGTTQSTTTNYSIPRSGWTQCVIPIDEV